MAADFSWAEQQLVAAIQQVAADISASVARVEAAAIEAIKSGKDAKILAQRDRLLEIVRHVPECLAESDKGRDGLCYECMRKASGACEMMGKARAAIAEIEKEA